MKFRNSPKKKFALFAENPAHPSLQLKPVGGFWSARVTEAYRALAVRAGNEFTWCGSAVTMNTKESSRN
jgi:hypothetical protein